MSTRSRDHEKAEVVDAPIRGDESFPRRTIKQMLGAHRETVKPIFHDDLCVKNLDFDGLPHVLAIAREAGLIEKSRRLIHYPGNPTYRHIGNICTEDIARICLGNAPKSLRTTPAL
jgi:hypothetical protein